MVTEQEYTDDQQCSGQEAVRNGLKKARERLGLTPEWMAEKAGYSLIQYNRLENGERKITVGDVKKVGIVIIDYEDSLKSPLKRVWTRVQYYIYGILFEVPEQLVVKDRDGKILFRIRTETIIMFSVIYLVVGLTGVTGYKIGFALGTAVKWIQAMLLGS